MFEFSTLATTYSPLASTIGTTGLNFWVRNVTRCGPGVEPPTYKTQTGKKASVQYNNVTLKTPRRRHRRISTPRLNTLLCVHLEHINVIISHGPQMIPYLKDGFPLRCFQRLSIPDIATQRSRGRENCYTRGQFTPVLSY